MATCRIPLKSPSIWLANGEKGTTSCTQCVTPVPANAGKLVTARWFYRADESAGDVEIPPDAGDFRLVDRRALDGVIAMLTVATSSGHVRLGRATARPPSTMSVRPCHAGRTKFSSRRMASFAADGVISFLAAPSAAPTGGFVVLVLSILSGVTAVVLKITWHLHRARLGIDRRRNCASWWHSADGLGHRRIRRSDTRGGQTPTALSRS